MVLVVLSSILLLLVILLFVTLHLSASSGSAETEQPTGGREISDSPAQLEESPGGQLSCHG